MRSSILKWGSVAGLLLLACGASAQVVQQPSPPNGIACAYNSTPPTLTTGQAGWVQCDSTGHLTITTIQPITGGAIAFASTAAESNRVIKATPGSLNALTITIGATSGYVMLFNATALPANGAVTPAWCMRIISDGTAASMAVAFPAAQPFSTGITAGFSTTGCYTLTASATAAFFGSYQ